MGVFGVQNGQDAGVEREEAQGKRLSTLARKAGVEPNVYTSVGSAHKQTGVPHFDNKWRIEETVRGLSGSHDFRLEQVGVGHALGHPNELLLLLRKISAEILRTLRTQPNTSIHDFDWEKTSAVGNLDCCV